MVSFYPLLLNAEGAEARSQQVMGSLVAGGECLPGADFGVDYGWNETRRMEANGETAW